MKKITQYKSTLILVGTVAVLLIGITAVIAFRYVQSPLDSVQNTNVIQKVQVSAFASNILSKTDNTSKPDIKSVSSQEVYGYSKPAKMSKEMTAFALPKKNRTTYEASISTTRDTNETPSIMRAGIIEKEYDYNSWPDTREEEVIDSSTYSVSASGSTPLSNTSAYYVPEDNPFQYNKQSSDSEYGSDKDEISQDEDPDTNYSITVMRDFISGSSDDGEINVILSINIDTTPPNGLIVNEFIPKGWDVFDSSQPYNNFNSSTGEIKWLFFGGEVGSMEISYRVRKIDSIADQVSFHGTYLYNNPDGDHMSRPIYGANDA